MIDSHIRILFYSESPVFGGAEEYLRQIIRGPDHRGFSFSFVFDVDSKFGRFAENLAEDDVTVDRIHRIRGKFDLNNLLNQVRYFRRLSPDIVHFNQSNPYSQQYSVLAAKLAGISTIIATYHLTPRERTKTLRGRLFERCVLSLCRCIIVLSEQNRAELLSHFSVTPGKVKVLENGIEDPGEIPHTDLVKLKGELGIHNGKHVVSCAGRLTPQKGFGHLVEAAALLHREDLAIVIAGEGPLLPLLQEKVKRFGLQDAVIFAGFREDVWKLFCLSEFVVLPSLYEGQPLVLLEAMAAGKAAVASRVYGLADTIKNGETGILVEPGSPRHLATAIGSLLDDPALCRQMGTKARELYEQKYTVLEFQARMDELYRELVKNGRRS